jgi:hypothetical protein
MGLTILNACVNIHLNNMIARRKNACEKIVSNVMGLKVHGRAPVDQNSFNIRQ